MLSRINIILILLVATQISKTNTKNEVLKNVKNLIPYVQEIILRIPAIKNFTLTIPEDCKKIGICDHIPNYPQKIIDTIIAKIKTMKNVIFNTDVQPKRSVFFYDAYLEDEIKLCPSHSELYSPQAARDVNSQYRIILNTPKPLQSFDITICDEEPNACNETSIAYGYKAGCKQKWLFRNMIALNTDLDAVVKEIFQVPSCCVCAANLQD